VLILVYLVAEVTAFMVPKRLASFLVVVDQHESRWRASERILFIFFDGTLIVCFVESNVSPKNSITLEGRIMLFLRFIPTPSDFNLCVMHPKLDTAWWGVLPKMSMLSRYWTYWRPLDRKVVKPAFNILENSLGAVNKPKGSTFHNQYSPWCQKARYLKAEAHTGIEW
jgi:hypothetical protein